MSRAHHFFKVFTLLLFIGLLTGCNENEKQSIAPPPAEVDVAQPLKHIIVEWDDYTGRFEAINRVDIRSRVTGYLVEKKFKDGQRVKKGDVLFVIDPRPFEYEKQRMQARYNLALKEYKRADGLRVTRAISQNDFDRRAQELQVAEASLNDAKLNLEFTNVTSPIDGKVSDDFINVGNLVRANETLLTRVVSVDPIHFEFEASQSALLKYIRLDRAGKRPGSDTTPNPVFVKLPDEDSYNHVGRMDFVDNIVDPGTGTIQGRALIENKDAIIYPGLFGRLRLIGSGEYEAILLPEGAINTDQNRKFVYTISEDNKAGRAYVRVGPVLDNGFTIIRDGLTGNERVVINGTQRIRAADQPVTPNEAPLEWVALNTMPDLNSVPTLSDLKNDPEGEQVQEETTE